MATVANVTYAHIVKEPGYCGGKAAVDATRVRVGDVVWLYKEGFTAAQVLDHYPDLSIGQVHAALTYYYDHVAEIEAELVRNEEAGADFERRKAELLDRRSRQ